MRSSESSLQADFQKDGFYILKEPALDTDLVNRARAGMDLLREGVYDTGTPHAGGKWKPGDDPNSLCKMEIPQLGNLAIRELITSEEIGRLAAEATGAAMIQVWWVQLLYKPPTPNDEQAPNRVGWHQDWNYWKPSWERRERTADRVGSAVRRRGGFRAHALRTWQPWLGARGGQRLLQPGDRPGGNRATARKRVGGSTSADAGGCPEFARQADVSRQRHQQVRPAAAQPRRSSADRKEPAAGQPQRGDMQVHGAKGDLSCDLRRSVSERLFLSGRLE